MLSGGGSVPAEKASAATWVDMVNDYQKGSLSTRLGIPMIYGIDAVHGHNNVYGATVFPHNVGLGSTRQVDFLLPCLLLVESINILSINMNMEKAVGTVNEAIRQILQ